MSIPLSPASASCSAPRERQPVRVVLDASVVMSALVFGGGAPAVLRHAWQRRRFTPLLCADTLLDLEAQLSAPQLGLQASERWRLLNEYVPYAHCVGGSCQGVMAHPATAPPAVKYSRLAMVGRARAWVTADLELLALQSEGLCPRYSVDAFVAMMLRQRRHRDLRHALA